MALAGNPARLGVVTHGSDEAGKQLVAVAPEHFADALGELATIAKEENALPAELHAAHAQLTHPNASLAEKREALIAHPQSGSGLFDIIKTLAKPLVGLARTAAANPAVRKVAGDFVQSHAKDAAQRVARRVLDY